MKLIIDKFALCCVFVLFCSQALAQTSRPESFCRYSHEMKIKKDGTYTYIKKDNLLFNHLPQNFFPWGVCFKKPYFREINGASVTSTREDDWTRDAMRRWNIAYRNYILILFELSRFKSLL